MNLCPSAAASVSNLLFAMSLVLVISAIFSQPLIFASSTLMHTSTINFIYIQSPVVVVPFVSEASSASVIPDLVQTIWYLKGSFALFMPNHCCLTQMVGNPSLYLLIYLPYLNIFYILCLNNF